MRPLLVCNRTVLASRVCYGAGRRASTFPAYAKMPRSAMAVLMRGWGPGPASGAHRHSGTDAGNSHRARRVAPACEIVGEDHITRPKTARGAIADPDFHLPRENKNVLPPGRGVPIAEIVRRETAEHEIGARLKRNVMALLCRQGEIFKMGLAVLARIYPYDHARAPSSHERRLVTLGQALGVAERRDALLVCQHADRPCPVGAPHAALQPERIDDAQYRLPNIVVGERLVRHRAGAADLHPYVVVLSQGEQLRKIRPNVGGDRRASR